MKKPSDAVVDDADWFHAHSRNGKWSAGNVDSTVIGGDMPSWTKLRYSFHDTPCTEVTPNKTRTITDMSFIDFRVLKEPIVMDFKANGWVSEQYTNGTNPLDLDVMNVFVDGNWVYQASAGNNIAKKCQMNEFVTTHSLHHDNGWEDNILVLKPGIRSIAIEVKSNAESFHDGAFYEIEFMMTPLSKTPTEE